MQEAPGEDKSPAFFSDQRGSVSKQPQEKLHFRLKPEDGFVHVATEDKRGCCAAFFPSLRWSKSPGKLKTCSWGTPTDLEGFVRQRSSHVPYPGTDLEMGSSWPEL